MPKHVKKAGTENKTLGVVVPRAEQVFVVAPRSVCSRPRTDSWSAAPRSHAEQARITRGAFEASPCRGKNPLLTAAIELSR